MTPLLLTDITNPQGNTFEFADFEIPESISFGGVQVLKLHTLVGGARVVDCLGQQPRPVEWAGEFIGANALIRAQYLDTQRKQATLFQLRWSTFLYQGVIELFDADFMQETRIPYRIRFLPEQDLTLPINIGINATIDDAILGDAATANSLAVQVNDSTLTTLMGTLNAAIAAVTSFANATQSVINSVLTPIQQVQSRVQTLIAASENTIRNLTTFGGLVPNNPVAQQAASLSSKVNTFTQGAALNPLNAVLGRMSTNLTNQSVSAPAAQTKTVQVSGGTLFQVAATQYGDASQWLAIAQANGLKDTVISGNMTLKIPPAPPGTQPQVRVSP